MSGDLERIADRLESIADELADLALDRLRAAAEGAGDEGSERLINRARRAVVKAESLLRASPEERRRDEP